MFEHNPLFVHSSPINEIILQNQSDFTNYLLAFFFVSPYLINYDPVPTAWTLPEQLLVPYTCTNCIYNGR